MEKKYTFRHFMIVEGERKEIDPLKNSELSDRCKLAWVNVVSKKEYVFKAAQ